MSSQGRGKCQRPKRRILAARSASISLDFHFRFRVKTPTKQSAQQTESSVLLGTTAPIVTKAAARFVTRDIYLEEAVFAEHISGGSLRDLKGENQVLFRILELIVGGMPMETKNVNEFPELSLMEGGPGDALMKRLRLIRLNSVLLRLGPLSAWQRLRGSHCWCSPLSKDWRWVAPEVHFFMIWLHMLAFWLRYRYLFWRKFRSEGVCGRSSSVFSIWDSSATRKGSDSQAASLILCGFAIGGSRS